jgi:tRNA A37 threonylcarbamoyladenosine synthetase subunit TsaC/SUA5/YrdC
VGELLAGEDAIVVDDGTLPGGPPSTVVELRGAEVRVVRPGRVPVAALRAVTTGRGEST